ncbi:DUF4241 domain-containing protein [Flavobacterium beibuense]|uniref:DUF4241 domain-containing protein n=1 Tax=Flavobacterium beibuense TaxID=657326 RepID=UPI00069141D6|nr:DUF4241 domain-containing protein [Flavobacterium beibuense]
MENSNDFEFEYNLDDDMDMHELVEIHVGDLNLPTGKIIAADPFFTYDQRPFKRTVLPDKYPVYVNVTEIDEEHFRIAYAKIKFRSKDASKWVLAITDDITKEEMDELTDDEFFGFPVDSGLACFLDEETNAALNAKMDALQEKDPEANYYDEVLADEFKAYSSKNKFSRELGDWNDHRPDSESDNNVIMFASGWGDGYYPAYWGLDENGETIELVIDFLINDFEDNEDEDYD